MLGSRTVVGFELPSGDRSCANKSVNSFVICLNQEHFINYELNKKFKQKMNTN
jgi:hypothetical protein